MPSQEFDSPAGLGTGGLGFPELHRSKVVGVSALLEDKLLPRATPCILCVGKTRRAPIDANAVPREDFQNLKLGRRFVLSLRTILVRCDFDDNTSIDSGAEGRCFAKGSDVEFTPHRAPHESHSITPNPGVCQVYNHQPRTRVQVQIFGNGGGGNIHAKRQPRTIWFTAPCQYSESAPAKHL